MRRRALLVLLLTLAIACAAPLLGVKATGASIAPYLDLPPRTEYVAHAAFAWPAFIMASMPVLAAMVLYAAALLRAPAPRAALPHRTVAAGLAVTSPRYGFPWWTWIGIGLAAGGWVLAWSDLFPAHWRRHAFTPLWLGYVGIMNALTYRRSGRSPLTHRAAWLAALFPASAAFWWLFEYLNQYTDNWYYTGLRAGDGWDYFAQATLPFSTVLPAVASTWAWLKTFPRLDTLALPAVPARHAYAYPWIGLVGGTIALGGLGVWPEALYPVLWLGPVFLLAGLQQLLLGETPLAPLARGDWRPILQPALAALVCGCFWELWNADSLAQWHYSIPYVQRFHIFEMPLLGYAGYLPFGVECALVMNLVAIIVGRKSAMRGVRDESSDRRAVTRAPPRPPARRAARARWRP